MITDDDGPQFDALTLLDVIVILLLACLFIALLPLSPSEGD